MFIDCILVLFCFVFCQMEATMTKGVTVTIGWKKHATKQEGVTETQYILENALITRAEKSDPSEPFPTSKHIHLDTLVFNTVTGCLQSARGGWVGGGGGVAVRECAFSARINTIITPILAHKDVIMTSEVKARHNYSLSSVVCVRPIRELKNKARVSAAQRWTAAAGRLSIRWFAKAALTLQVS